MYVCNNAVMITDLLGLLRSASEYIDMYGDFGHLLTSQGRNQKSQLPRNPDDAFYYRDAFNQAMDRSKHWLTEWNNHCCKSGKKANAEPVKYPEERTMDTAAPPNFTPYPSDYYDEISAMQEAARANSWNVFYLGW